MIKDWSEFARLAIQSKLIIKEGAIDCAGRSVDWEDLPIFTDSYILDVIVNADIQRGGVSKPVIEFWDCEGERTKKYTIYFSDGSWKDALQFLGVKDLDAQKAFRFLSEVSLLGQESSQIRKMKDIGDCLATRAGAQRFVVEKFSDGKEVFAVASIVPNRWFQSFDELMDDTHKIYVGACANHLKADQKAEKERDRG